MLNLICWFPSPGSPFKNDLFVLTKERLDEKSFVYLGDPEPVEIVNIM